MKLSMKFHALNINNFLTYQRVKHYFKLNYVGHHNTKTRYRCVFPVWIPSTTWSHITEALNKSKQI